MTAEDLEEFGRLLAALSEAFGEVLSAERTQVYFRALADLPLEEVRQAVDQAIKTRTFFPKPAELRTLAGRGLPDVGMVAALVIAHLRRETFMPMPPRDPFLALVVQRLGGMRVLSETPVGVWYSMLRTVLPGVIVAAQARALELPTEAPELPTHARLLLEGE